jgi:glutamate racemase
MLGCTHFPILRDAIEGYLGPNVEVVDSAVAAASAVREELHARGLETTSAAGSLQFLATDAPERFAEIGRCFLGGSLAVADVERIDL